MFFVTDSTTTRCAIGVLVLGLMGFDAAAAQTLPTLDDVRTAWESKFPRSPTFSATARVTSWESSESEPSAISMIQFRIDGSRICYLYNFYYAENPEEAVVTSEAAYDGRQTRTLGHNPRNLSGLIYAGYKWDQFRLPELNFISPKIFDFQGHFLDLLDLEGCRIVRAAAESSDLVIVTPDVPRIPNLYFRVQLAPEYPYLPVMLESFLRHPDDDSDDLLFTRTEPIQYQPISELPGKVWPSFVRIVVFPEDESKRGVQENEVINFDWSPEFTDSSFTIVYPEGSVFYDDSARRFTAVGDAEKTLLLNSELPDPDRVSQVVDPELRPSASPSSQIDTPNGDDSRSDNSELGSSSSDDAAGGTPGKGPFGLLMGLGLMGLGLLGIAAVFFWTFRSKWS